MSIYIYKLFMRACCGFAFRLSEQMSDVISEFTIVLCVPTLCFYQVGFSGDVQHSWKSLAFQPYFSQSGTNVGYGFWSNDIIGHLLDYELQTRWVQWGSLSAIFRIHDAGAAAGSCADHGGCVCVCVCVNGV